jgi:hypothetical protein
VSDFLDAIDYGMSSIDKPFRAARGALAGKPREMLAAVPFSDSLGLTDPSQNTSGLEIARKWGIARPEDSLADSILGAGVEQAVDPFHLATGAAAIFGAGRMSKAARAVMGKKASAMVSVMPYVDDAEFLSHMNDTSTPIGKFKRLADTAGVKFGLGDDVERVENAALELGRGDNNLASAYAGFYPSDNEVRINRFRPDIWTGDTEAADMIEAITGRRDRASKEWFSTDMPTPLHAGTHEIGHALHFDKLGGRFRLGVLNDDALLDRLAKVDGRSTEFDNRVAEIMNASPKGDKPNPQSVRDGIMSGWWNALIAPQIDRGLSRYGSTDPAETVAEGWTRLSQQRALGRATGPDRLNPEFVNSVYAGLSGPDTQRHPEFIDQLGRFLRGDNASVPLGQGGVSPTQLVGTGVGLGGAGIAATDDDPSNDWAVPLGLAAAGMSAAPGLARSASSGGLADAIKGLAHGDEGSLNLKYDNPHVPRGAQSRSPNTPELLGLERTDPEWLNNRTFYHGTASGHSMPGMFDPAVLDISKGDPHALHGPGFYTTEEAGNPRLPITKGYGESRLGNHIQSGPKYLSDVDTDELDNARVAIAAQALPRMAQDKEIVDYLEKSMAWTTDYDETSIADKLAKSGGDYGSLNRAQKDLFQRMLGSLIEEPERVFDPTTGRGFPGYHARDNALRKIKSIADEYVGAVNYPRAYEIPPPYGVIHEMQPNITGRVIDLDQKASRDPDLVDAIYSAAGARFDRNRAAEAIHRMLPDGQLVHPETGEVLYTPDNAMSVIRDNTEAHALDSMFSQDSLGDTLRGARRYTPRQPEWLIANDILEKIDPQGALGIAGDGSMSSVTGRAEEYIRGLLDLGVPKQSNRSVFDFQRALLDAGIQGLTHTGGQIKKKAPHQVLIHLDPANTIAQMRPHSFKTPSGRWTPIDR